MFLEKLTKLLGGMFHQRPKYITVTPVGGNEPVAALPPARIPRHVAIIMDGNGRWARQRGQSRSAGHAAGVEALRDIIRASDECGIEVLSIYAFSTENWARGKEEVDALMGLLLRYFNSEIDELDEKNVRITILGDVDGLPEPQRDAVVRAMERTRNNDGLRLNIALNYGGRAELVRAARILAAQVRDGVIEPEDITEDMFAEELYTTDCPDVDLLIRTSGEMRTSNFLPWQLTYAEFIFDNTLWPDFTRERYMKCLREYAGRERRFGRENAQESAGEKETPGATAPEDSPQVLDVKPAAVAEDEPQVLDVKPAAAAQDEPQAPDEGAQDAWIEDDQPQDAPQVLDVKVAAREPAGEAPADSDASEAAGGADEAPAPPEPIEPEPVRYIVLPVGGKRTPPPAPPEDASPEAPESDAESD